MHPYSRQMDNSHVHHLRKDASDHYIQSFVSFKDLGVTFDTNLSFKFYVTEKINKDNSMSGIIKRKFSGLNCDAFLMLYKKAVLSQGIRTMPLLHFAV